MTKGVNFAKGDSLKKRTTGAHQQRCNDECRPKPNPIGQGVPEIGTDHVKTGMREIEHAHHAENQGQPGTEHEQQQPVTEAVEHGDDEKLHHKLSRPCKV